MDDSLDAAMLSEDIKRAIRDAGYHLTEARCWPRGNDGWTVQLSDRSLLLVEVINGRWDVQPSERNEPWSSL